mmetsp:Transcript_10698/g.43279  ORF Transcript_10698/g.43279 Transcript_10698/m.43279 type:complete len:264 (-) Transcript_10698:77-868(-)
MPTHEASVGAHRGLRDGRHGRDRASGRAQLWTSLSLRRHRRLGRRPHAPRHAQLHDAARGRDEVRLRQPTRAVRALLARPVRVGLAVRVSLLLDGRAALHRRPRRDRLGRLLQVPRQAAARGRELPGRAGVDHLVDRARLPHAVVRPHQGQVGRLRPRQHGDLHRSGPPRRRRRRGVARAGAVGGRDAAARASRCARTCGGWCGSSRPRARVCFGGRRRGRADDARQHCDAGVATTNGGGGQPRVTACTASEERGCSVRRRRT